VAFVEGKWGQNFSNGVVLGIGGVVFPADGAFLFSTEFPSPWFIVPALALDHFFVGLLEALKITESAAFFDVLVQFQIGFLELFDSFHADQL
jgi:hypothetical protein